MSRRKEEKPFGSKRVSLFNMTINSNIGSKSERQECEVFKKLVKGFHEVIPLSLSPELVSLAGLRTMSDTEIQDALEDCFIFLSPNASKLSENDGTEHRYQFAGIENIEVMLKLEVGSEIKGKRIHLHAVIQVTHHSKIHINADAFRVSMREQLGSNVYVWVKGIHDPKRAMEIYLSKPQPIPNK